MLLRRQANDDRDEHIDMTPMVDVVFQLMTFMLFSIQMTGGEAVDVPAARHGVGVAETDATFLTLIKPVKPGAVPQVLIGNGEGVPASPEQIKKAVADGVRAGRRKVVLQAVGGVPHGEVLKLVGTITEVEGITVHIGVQEPEVLK